MGGILFPSRHGPIIIYDIAKNAFLEEERGFRYSLRAHHAPNA
jgi:hypothetical protein